jgi:hypothetical protein
LTNFLEYLFEFVLVWRNLFIHLNEEIENFFNSMIISKWLLYNFRRGILDQIKSFRLLRVNLLFFRQSRCSRQFVPDWVSDCCLTPIQQFFSYIMGRTSKFSMRWWWGSLCTRPTRGLEFYSACSLKQQSLDRHVAPLGHIILIPSEPICVLSP